MTNAEMLCRLEKLSTRALKRNAKAAEETEVHWKGLAAGELDAKPDCPYCNVHRYDCNHCALNAVTADINECAVAFGEWSDAKGCAETRRLKYPLRSKPVRAAAKRMLAHVRRVGMLVRVALEGRTK